MFLLAKKQKEIENLANKLFYKPKSTSPVPKLKKTIREKSNDKPSCPHCQGGLKKVD